MGMEAATFETWLGTIATLTGTQRQRACEALALSEAVVTAEGGSREPVLPELAGPARSVGTTAAAARADTATIPDLGQRKVAITGCPHCGQAEIVRWGTSSGLPRYRCKT